MIDKKLTASLDLVKLEPGMLLQDVEALCKQAIQFGCASVCLPALFAARATAMLKGSGVQLIACIGFPYGYQATESKLAEMVLAFVDGVHEVEVLINYTAIKNGDWNFVANEINHLLPIARNAQKKLTIVLETTRLSRPEIIKCCELYSTAEVDGICANTGITASEPALEELAFIRGLIPAPMKYK
jgi:deoxyribose-phosphate aldolase